MPQPRCVNAPATANLFIQLSMRRQAVSWYGLPILDLFLPSPLRAIGAPALRAHRTVSNTTRTTSIRSIASHSGSRSSGQWRGATLNNTLAKIPTTTRAFSTSPTSRATQTLFNPQVDEDGQEMVLQITPRAAKVHPSILSLASPHPTRN